MIPFIFRTILLCLFLSDCLGAFSQEYTYDNQGNLASDTNKKIASIHYNHLDLADTITYTDGRTIIYTYAASGQKIMEQALAANRTVVTQRTYSGDFLYSNDTLREIQHSDGRAIPSEPGNSATAWEYQYHLEDHLGNTRATLTSQPVTEAHAATFETTTNPGGFLRYEDARRINAVLFDHTHAGTTHYAQRLNGTVNERYGLARSLSVMPGDTVKLEVYAKYADPNSSNWNAAMTTLLTQIASGTAHAGTVVDGTGYATNGGTPFPFAGLNNTAASTGTGPKAYLNWLIFNRDFTFRSGGFVRMSTIAKENGSNVAHEKLASRLAITAPGYVYVYLSNEENTPLEVYFDDLAVMQVDGPVIQQTDYDPFGLTFSEYARENTTPNHFLYNGKELQKDFDLNWYDYGARRYDAALGRWHVPDPMAEKYMAWSPYAYVMNNPVKFVDPDGRDGELVIDTENKTATIRANYYTSSPEEMGRLLDAIDVWRQLSGKETMSINGEKYKLNFSLTAMRIKGGVDPKDFAEADPIGNVFHALPGDLTVNGEAVPGNTEQSKYVTVAGDASSLTAAHELGHTFMGVADPNHEHVPNTVMAAYDDDQEKRIDKGVVNNIKRTYGLVKNNYPTESFTATVTSSKGVRTIYYGENFIKTTLPKVSNEDLLKQFRKLTYDPQQ